jgi:hypothetical protein
MRMKEARARAVALSTRQVLISLEGWAENASNIPLKFSHLSNKKKNQKSFWYKSPVLGGEGEALSFSTSLLGCPFVESAGQ